MNEKIALSEEKMRSGDESLSLRISELENALRGLSGAFGDTAGLKGGLQRIQD